VCAEKLGIVDQDIDAFIDPTLTYKENLEIIMAEYGCDSITAMAEVESELARVLNQGKPKRNSGDKKRYPTLRWKVLNSQSTLDERKKEHKNTDPTPEPEIIGKVPEIKEHTLDDIPTIIEVLHHILPENSKISMDRGGINNIVHLNILIYGSSGAGKTETAYTIVEQIKNSYGLLNVNVVWANQHIQPLFEGIQDKLVNVLIGDNLTIREQSQKELADFFEVRHIIQNRTGRNVGLVVTIMVVHRFHGLDKNLRSSIDLFFAKDVPADPYDYQVLEGFYGTSLLRDFGKLKMDSGNYGLTAWCVPHVTGGVVDIPIIPDKDTIKYANIQEPIKQIHTLPTISLVDVERQQRIQLRKQQQILKNIEKARKRSPIHIPNFALQDQGHEGSARIEKQPNVILDTNYSQLSTALPFRVQKRILKHISKGERKTNRIADLSKNPSDKYNRHNKRLWRETVAKGILQMERDGLIEWGGLLLKGWRLTSKGMWILNSKRR